MIWHPSIAATLKLRIIDSVTGIDYTQAFNVMRFNDITGEMDYYIPDMDTKQPPRTDIFPNAKIFRPQ